MRRVGVVVFDRFELLDVFGPLEIFGVLTADLLTELSPVVRRALAADVASALADLHDGSTAVRLDAASVRLAATSPQATTSLPRLWLTVGFGSGRVSCRPVDVARSRSATRRSPRRGHPIRERVADDPVREQALTAQQ